MYRKSSMAGDAFEEAYKDLLNMYIRLGGKPRNRP